MINNFLSHFASHKDFSKSYRFEVVVGCPPGLRSVYSDSVSDLRFQCEQSELPGYNINTLDGRTYGETYAVAATPVYNDLNLTFICAGDLWEKHFFDDWMDFILPKGDSLAKYREEYVTSIEVKSFLDVGRLDNKGGEPAFHIKFNEIFPISVAPISLNWANSDINRLSVVFKYKNWKRISLPKSEIGVGIDPTARISQFTNSKAKNFLNNMGHRFNI